MLTSYMYFYYCNHRVHIPQETCVKTHALHEASIAGLHAPVLLTGYMYAVSSTFTHMYMYDRRSVGFFAKPQVGHVSFHF